jgi:hypothetical protein
MIIHTGENEDLGEKHVPLPLYPPQIPHGLNWAQTRASAVGGRRLTALAIAQRGQWGLYLWRTKW